ncbi:phage tail protein [Serratia microhaemolytica]|uniref:phage tail protein n=1 Tax=Serratia microhaemolytica TaxID=2675110 RepID=UPI000FDE6C07|nr:phage tail protein [Serratia microhaemolytica]
MHRIDTPTAQKDKFGAGKNGFTRGNPQTGVQATQVDDDYFDAHQEELAGVVEGAGLSLEKGNNTQLFTAIKKIVGAEVPIASKTTAGITKLSSATDSDDETMAATPKAVKTVAVPVGIPQPWPQATPPSGWLKCNGASFDKAKYPLLAAAYPSGKLPDLRGEFIRGWDDARGVDKGRGLLSWQGDAIRNITGECRLVNSGLLTLLEHVGSFAGAFIPSGHQSSAWLDVRGLPTISNPPYLYPGAIGFDASKVVPTASENRPRNIAFNYIVRAA